MPNSKTIDLTPSDLHIVRQILAQHVPGLPVFVFGSRATGRARRRSDLDLAIGGDAPLGRRIKANLRYAFDESDLPIEVDVVDLTDATGIFRTRIENEWIPLDTAIKQVALQATA
jgi:predicted nucleotidyltransferase